MRPPLPDAGISVVVADDHALLRAGFTMLLEQIPGVEVAGEAGNGVELVALVESVNPDIVFTDIDMPKMDGLEAIARLAKSRPRVRYLVLSMHDTAEMVRRAAGSGANGYLMKNASAQELRTAIDTVMSRGSYYSPSVAALLLAPGTPGPSELLTQRQIEIVKRLARGQSSKEIAFELGLSAKTVDAHRAGIMQRLEISDVASLTRYAIKHGLVNL